MVIFWLKFTLSFIKIVPDQTSKAFNIKFGQSKDRESSYQVGQILALLCKLVALILDLNFIEGLRLTKIVKQMKHERVWGELVVRNNFQRKSFTNVDKL